MHQFLSCPRSFRQCALRLLASNLPIRAVIAPPFASWAADPFVCRSTAGSYQQKGKTSIAVSTLPRASESTRSACEVRLCRKSTYQGRLSSRKGRWQRCVVRTLGERRKSKFLTTCSGSSHLLLWPRRQMYLLSEKGTPRHRARGYSATDPACDVAQRASPSSTEQLELS